MSKTAFNLAQNPLVNPPQLPNGAPPLDQIKTEHFEPAIDWAIEKAQERLDAIKNQTGPLSFSSTFEAYETASEELSRIMSIFSNQVSTMGDDELRDLQENIIGPKLSRFSSAVTYDEDLFACLKTVYDNRLNLDLTADQTTLMNNTYNGFKKNGALLPAAKKQRLAVIDEQMGKLSTRFFSNMIKSAQSFEKLIDNEEDLAGLSDSIKKTYKDLADKSGHQGKWLIPMAPPPIDILENAANRELRKEMWQAMGKLATTAPHDNRPVILEILNLRQERAEILGFKNHAEYVLSGRMAQNVHTVETFLNNNLQRYKPAAEEELKRLEVFSWKLDNLAQIEPWDYAYYHNKLKEQTFQFKREEVKPYFELDNVVKGLFAHAEKLFDIKVTDTAGKYPVHNPDVKTYELHDNKSGALLGVFYADYYARPGAKREGAWMTDFRGRGRYNGQNEVPLVINVCNIPQPPAGEPTLLTMDQVRTLFHEFGHGLHGLLAEGENPSLTGTNVKWDWVETPSQLMENWITEKEVLDNFAVHYKTGAKIPADMVQKINDMANFGAASMGLRQTSLALLDMGFHTADPSKISAVEDFEKAATAPATLTRTSHMATRFAHIFAGGYSAGYYSYKWASVLEADIYSRFQEKGLYDRETAHKVRENIYAKGGRESPLVLFKRVMGRDPDPEALYRREGLSRQDANKKKNWLQRCDKPQGPA